MAVYTITTLVENCVYNRALHSEHGLSLYIRTPQHRILFDTGQSNLFLHNAQLLHTDLKEIDYLILSHGHSDHTGGLHAFMAYNSKAIIYCKREILNRKFKKGRENGILHADTLDFSRFRFIEEAIEISPGVMVCPDIPLYNKADTHFDSFYTEIGGKRIADQFQDELALFLTTPDTYSVLSACSHRGITNIMEKAQSFFPNRTFDTLIGGFHIHTAGEEKYNIIANYLRKNSPRQIGVCHCTGVDQFARFIRDFPQITIYNCIGTTMQIRE